MKLTGSSGAAKAQDEHLHGHLAAACALVLVRVAGEDIGPGTRGVVGGVGHCEGLWYKCLKQGGW